MAAIAKTVVATGVSSGLGLEAMKQLLGQAQPWKIVLGARNTAATQAAYDGFTVNPAAKGASSVTVLPLELSDLHGVRAFAQQALAALGNDKIDYLLLNAAIAKPATETGQGPNRSKWCETYIVNHLSQHYLVHLLRDKLVADKSRLVFVSSGAVRNVPDTSALSTELLAGSGVGWMQTYANTKFAALLGAHWWRRELRGGGNAVVAVSPGLIPGTGLGRSSGMTIPMDLADAKTVPEGAENLLRAFNRDDFPDDPDQIFLTSWGEWWPKDVYGKSLDKELQDKWCPSKEEIEMDEGI